MTRPAKGAKTAKRATVAKVPKRAGSARAEGRITGRAVPPLVPARGSVRVFLIGEAPGPNGADKSLVPFFGDAAGKHLYAGLAEMGAMSLPRGIDELPWDGQAFVAAGMRPTPHGVALGNAFDRCPTDDGVKFRAPSRAELTGSDNIARLAADIQALHARGLRGIVTMGRVATNTVEYLLKRNPMPELVLRAVPHPSALGLLSMGKDRPRGTKMSELQEIWKEKCAVAVREAGFTRADGKA